MYLFAQENQSAPRAWRQLAGKVSALLLLSAFALAPATASAQTSLPMVQQQGKHWVADGTPIRLEGTNVGNWLQLEMWMMNSALSNNAGVIHDQCTLEDTLKARFGYAEKERLMDVFRDNWMTDRDWDNIAAMGYNVVRLPFWHSLIEDEDNHFTLRPDAWEYLDLAISKAAERGMYTILDLHGAAGSQGWEHHSGCADRNWYWDGGNGQPASYYQDRTHWLWKQIAQRYSGNSNVAGYNLLNEAWGTSQPELLAANLHALYDTVRTVDQDHIVILGSHHTGGIDHLGNPGPNIAYDSHFYPGFWRWRENQDPTMVHTDWLFCSTNNGDTTCDWDEKINNLQIPFLVGEFQPWTELGANAGEVTRKHYDVYSDLGWASTAWAYKTVSTTPHSGDPADGWPWGLITNTTGFSPINLDTASNAEIEAWFAQFSSQTVVPHPDVAYWMNYEAKADGSNIEAEHFRSHSGANMEETYDVSGGEFHVWSLDAGDWMVYRVKVPQAGDYQLQYRVASKTQGTVNASLDLGADFGDTTIPGRKGGKNAPFETIVGPTVTLPAGEVDVRLSVPAGGWLLNWFQLIPQ